MPHCPAPRPFRALYCPRQATGRYALNSACLCTRTAAVPAWCDAWGSANALVPETGAVHRWVRLTTLGHVIDARSTAGVEATPGWRQGLATRSPEQLAHPMLVRPPAVVATVDRAASPVPIPVAGSGADVVPLEVCGKHPRADAGAECQAR